MSRYLFLGGPASGQSREVFEDEALATYIDTPSPLIVDPTLSQRASIFHRYARRDLRGTLPDGRTFRRVVYVHESVRPEEIQSELRGYLLGQWLKGGTEVTDGSTESSQSA